MSILASSLNWLLGKHVYTNNAINDVAVDQDVTMQDESNSHAMVQQKEPSLPIGVSEADLKDVFGRLQLKEIVDLVRQLPHAMILKIYPTLSEEYQNHLFPLLPKATREVLFTLASVERQADLLIQMDGFERQAQDSEKDINSAQSFLYNMAVLNAETYYNNRDKYTFIVKAKELLKYDFKPYKYQRSLMQKHVDAIAQGISQSKMMFHPIILGYIKNKDNRALMIVDGQHRWKALRNLPPSLQASLDVQIDVIIFPDNDEEIMNYYKYINTNVPIDPNKLQQELQYVSLVLAIKNRFPNNIKTYSKEAKDVPQHYVVDTWLKEELQYRELLSKFTTEEILNRFAQTNELLKQQPSLLNSLSMIETRMCKRDNVYIGVAWPLAIDIVEGRANAYKLHL